MKKLSQTLVALLLVVAPLMACVPRSPTPPAATVPVVSTTVAPTLTSRPASTVTVFPTPKPTNGPSPTAQATLPQQAALDSVADAIAKLQGLDFDAFLDASYRQLLLRNPQRITEIGLEKQFRLRDDQLANLSDEYLHETQKLELAVLSLLRTYDRGQLAPTQQLSAEVYAWYLEDQVRGHAFMYNDYPISPVLISYHTTLIQFFTDIHPV